MNTRTSTRTRKTATVATTRASLKFSPINGILLAVGILTIVAGFVMLGHGSTVGAPLLLVLGYTVIVPVGIII